MSAAEIREFLDRCIDADETNGGWGAFATCEALREIVELHSPFPHPPMAGAIIGPDYCRTCGDPLGRDVTPAVEYPCETIRVLLKAYEDMRGYRPEWQSVAQQ